MQTYYDAYCDGDDSDFDIVANSDVLLLIVMMVICKY
jgi:hypothetical protein